jgi:hypothetical protein
MRCQAVASFWSADEEAAVDVVHSTGEARVRRTQEGHSVSGVGWLTEPPYGNSRGQLRHALDHVGLDKGGGKST